MELFTSIFTCLEGQLEGLLIGNLAMELATDANRQNIYCFVAGQDGGPSPRIGTQFMREGSGQPDLLVRNI